MNLSTSFPPFSVKVFHETWQTSSLKISAEKLEKSRIFFFFEMFEALVVFIKQNCEKWPLISEMMFPLSKTCSGLLTNMLSISVAELLYTRVGLSVVGMRWQLKRVERKLCAYRQCVLFSKSILISPIKQRVLPDEINFSTVSAKVVLKLLDGWIMLSI